MGEAHEDAPHTIDDHPELENSRVLRGYVHDLLHRVEALETQLNRRSRVKSVKGPQPKRKPSRARRT